MNKLNRYSRYFTKEFLMGPNSFRLLEEMHTLFETWAEGDDSLCFKTASWWKELLEKECGKQCELSVMEAECCNEAWEDWFSTGHEYGIRDREFLSRGLDRILNFSLIYVRKK